MPSGIGRVFVKYGTKTPHTMRTPMSIAMPLPMPMRYPAPTSAEE